MISGGSAGAFASGKVLQATQPCCPAPPPVQRQRLFLVADNPSTYREIANHSNTMVYPQGGGLYRIVKNGGTGGTYDADSVGIVGLVGNFVVRWQAPTGQDMFVGVSVNPTADANYTSIDHGVQIFSDNSTYYYESGTNRAGPATVNSGQYFFLRRTGSTIDFLYGATTDVTLATLQFTFPTADSNTLYFDSAIATLGGYADVYIEDTNVTTSVALTGQGLAVASGTLAPALSLVLSGQSLSVAQGSLTAAPALSIAGQSLSVARGSVTASPAAALTGQSVLVSRGSVVASSSLALTGQAVTVSRGTLLATSSLTLAGQWLTIAQGALAATNIPALTGQAIAASQGTLAPAFSAVLAGQPMIVSQGLLASVSTRALIGQSLVISRGALTAIGVSSWIPSTAPGVVTVTPSAAPSDAAVTVASTPSAVTLAVSSSPAAGTFLQDNDPAPLEWSA